MNYSFFLGCTIPAREPSYELSVRRVFKELEVNLIDLKGANCCAPMPIESLDFKTSLSIAAYNICLAEEEKLDIMTVCNGCFLVLHRANEWLKNKKELRAEINDILVKVGKEFKGTINVKDYLQVLYNDLGIDKIKESISKPLEGLKAAAFYGCHILKPSDVLKFDDPERPHILEDMIELTGATSVSYLHKNRCCGGLLRGVSDEVANKLARDKLFNISKAQADCIITVCPFCFLTLDVGQLSIRRQFNESYNLPVLHYPELLGLAIGVKSDELGLKTHRTSTESVLKKIG